MSCEYSAVLLVGLPCDEIYLEEDSEEYEDIIDMLETNDASYVGGLQELVTELKK